MFEAQIQNLVWEQDVDMPPLDELEKKAAEKLDGEIHGHQVYFYGLCEKCLKEAKNLG